MDQFVIPKRQMDFRCPCGRVYTRDMVGVSTRQRNGFSACPCGREFMFHADIMKVTPRGRGTRGA